VPLETTILTLKEFVNAESGVSIASQQFWFNGQVISNDNHTVGAAGIKDGDLVVVQVRQQQQAVPPRAQASSNSTPINQEAERMRQQILNNAQLRNNLASQMPQLAGALYDPVAFREVFQQMNAARSAEQARLDNLDNNITEENQAEVEKMIRMELIEQHRQEAMEENPECKFPADCRDRLLLIISYSLWES